MSRYRNRHDGRITAPDYRRLWVAPNGDRIVKNGDCPGYRCSNAAGEWMFDASDLWDVIYKYAYFHGKAESRAS